MTKPDDTNLSATTTEAEALNQTLTDLESRSRSFGSSTLR